MFTLLWWILVGLIAGWATGKIMKGKGYGTLVDILLGIAGAIFGGWILRHFGFAGSGGLIYTILVGIGGAVILTALARMLTRA
ncbi:MAG: GlsB/YeaQ/YmgE family stress response membrane protein [Acidobacteriia bacterium]|nr:GlsB/YeaQ/YmgE family stress response membrane protein [Terriglobia bacterium]